MTSDHIDGSSIYSSQSYERRKKLGFIIHQITMPIIMKK